MTERSGFSFRKELSNLVKTGMKITFSDIWKASGTGQETKISYSTNIPFSEQTIKPNKPYLKALIKPFKDLINAGRLEKYMGLNNMEERQNRIGSDDYKNLVTHNCQVEIQKRLGSEQIDLYKEGDKK